MKKITLRYGLYAAAFLIGFNLLIILIQGIPGPEDFKMGEVIGYSAIVLSLIFVFLGIKYRRDHELNGSISFSKALGTGLQISIWPSVAFALYNWIYTEFMDPDFLQKYQQYQLDQAEAKMTANEFEAYAKQVEQSMEMFANPFMSFLVMFLTVFVIGIVISIISALILKKSPQEPVTE